MGKQVNESREGSFREPKVGDESPTKNPGDPRLQHSPQPQRPRLHEEESVQSRDRGWELPG